MNNEIRMAQALPTSLENEVFDLRDEALAFLDENQIDQALVKITKAWELLPESKFNTSCSYLILCDLAGMLNQAGKHQEAKAILEAWIHDLKTSGYKIYETIPFILLGETFLYLKESELAIAAFKEAVHYGAGKRDFIEYLDLYFEIAKGKVTDLEEIQRLFDKETSQRLSLSSKEKVIGLSEELSVQIESLSEEGNVYFEDEAYENAILVWKRALDFIPKPQHTFAESLWLESSIGDAYFMQKKYDEARFHFNNAMDNIEEIALKNPFILLRTGQLHFEAGTFDEAKEFLLRAYMLEGEEIFEDSDGKYFEFLKENVKLES